MCPHLEPDTIAHTTGLAIEASYWTPSLMSQFNLAGGVGGCSTSLHYGRIVAFWFLFKKSFYFWGKRVAIWASVIQVRIDRGLAVKIRCPMRS